ncbi:MAG TPA: cysteine hydrolase [Firmicutes bacterium]|nr:cysteine hydrolase [Bacillota bacterium]
MSRKALLVIDMLNDFIDPKGALYVGDQARGVVEPIRHEIDRARREGIEVIYICDRHLESDPEFLMFPKHCVAGTWGAEIVPELAPMPHDRVIPKRRYSAFFQTDLDLTLRELGVTQIIVVGVCTNICDLYTVADARMLNYKVVVPKDCVSSFDQEAHRFALAEMERTLGAEVV